MMPRVCFLFRLVALRYFFLSSLLFVIFSITLMMVRWCWCCCKSMKPLVCVRVCQNHLKTVTRYQRIINYLQWWFLISKYHFEYMAAFQTQFLFPVLQRTALSTGKKPRIEIGISLSVAMIILRPLLLIFEIWWFKIFNAGKLKNNALDEWGKILISWTLLQCERQNSELRMHERFFHVCFCVCLGRRWKVICCRCNCVGWFRSCWYRLCAQSQFALNNSQSQCA